MSNGLLVACSLALACTALALWLWQWSSGHKAREASTRHLERQLRTQAEAQGAPAAQWRSATALDGPDAVAPSAAALAQSARTAERLPGWLQGVTTLRTLIAITVAGLLAAAVVAAIASPLSGAGALALWLAAAVFWLWLKVQRLRRKLVAQLPACIDTMVRLIAIGNSTQAAFQLAISSTQSPLRDALERAGSLVRGGANLDQALQQIAQQVRLEEMHLLAAVLGLGVRYGGRSDVLLERVANFMRDREQAEREPVAMSAETRLSAWILGLLPIVVGLMILVLNAGYFTLMWFDPTGRNMIFGAAALQVFGVILLYRLARLQ